MFPILSKKQKEEENRREEKMIEEKDYSIYSNVVVVEEVSKKIEGL